MTKYKHSLFVHVVCIGMSIAIGFIALGMLIDPHFHGSFAARISVVIVACLFSLGVLALYVTSGANRYEVMEDGLCVNRFFGTTFHPWNEIIRISWNQPLHTFFVHGPHRLIFYSSTDCFPKLAQFIQVMHEKSACQLSPNLTRALTRK